MICSNMSPQTTSESPESQNNPLFDGANDDGTQKNAGLDTFFSGFIIRTSEKTPEGLLAIKYFQTGHQSP